MGLSSDPPAPPPPFAESFGRRRDAAAPASSTVGPDRSALPGLPASWWDQPAILTALSAHDFTSVFAFLCGHGMTVTDIADRTGLDVAKVAAALAGQSAVDRYHELVALCDGLGVPRGHIGVAHRYPIRPGQSTRDGGPSRTGQPEPPAVWTGRHARALRVASRHTVRSFARLLGVVDRSVTKWDAGGDSIIPRPWSQQGLDLAFSRLTPAARAIYGRLLHDPDLITTAANDLCLSAGSHDEHAARDEGSA